MKNEEMRQIESTVKDANSVWLAVAGARRSLRVTQLLDFTERVDRGFMQMTKDGLLSMELEMEDNDFMVLHQVVNSLHRRGFLYCLIETQNDKGLVMGHRLRVSLNTLDVR